MEQPLLYLDNIDGRYMMNNKKALLSVLLASFLAYSSSAAVFAVENEELLPLSMDMFKYEQYLPAIELLEEGQEANKDIFNYWLYLGLAYQKTNQLKKALSAYQTAAKINPDAKNLEVRIKNLNKSIAAGSVFSELNSEKAKSEWLFQQAEKCRKEAKEEQALRLFIQAVGYDIKLLGKDNDFVRRGVIFYKLKLQDKAKYAKLFYAIFKHFEGDEEAAFKLISEFKEDNKEDKTPAIVYLENEYYEKITASNSEQKEIIKAEKEEQRLLQQAKIEAKKKEKSANKENKKENIASESSNIRELESEINTEKFAYAADRSFDRRFMQEIAKSKVTDYYGEIDPEKKRQLLWEIGLSGSQEKEVMEALIDGLKQGTIDYVSSSIKAITRIGSPSADEAVPVLIELLNSERGDFRYLAAEGLGRLKACPDVVIPALIEKHESELHDDMKKHYAKCGSYFGKQGLDVAYKMLMESTRIDRKPIAEYIHNITGEKVETLMNR